METDLLGNFDIYINDGNYGGIYPEKSLFTNAGVPFLSASDFSGKHFNFHGIKYVSEELHYDLLTKGHLKDGDIIIVVRGNGIGKVGYFDNFGFECNLNAQLAFIRTNPEELCSEFLYYLFSSDSYQKLIRKFGSGSAQPQLPINRLKLVPVIKIHIYTQRGIAAVLSALDDKIELNNQINTELEAMAKTLYDYWFVQFDFPDENGKPYQSSGGKMVFNETLKREIPVGWEVSNILEISELIGGGTPSTKNKLFWGGELPFFTPSDADNSIFSISTLQNITSEGLLSSSTKLFDKGIVFLTARGSVGKIMISSTKMAMNQSCYALKSKTASFVYLYFTAKQMVGYLHAKSSGSIFNAIVSADIKFTPVVNVPLNLINLFDEKMISLFDKILINLKQNQELAQLRDWLLPMLMNGQVRVGSGEYEREEESLGMVAAGKAD